MKLKNRSFYFTSDAGDKLQFNSNVYVTAEGEFEIEIPEELALLANSTPPVKNGSEVVIRKNEKLAIHGDSMDDCVSFICTIANEYFKCVSKTELVIVYNLKTTGSYWKHDDGSISANGVDAKTGEWADVGESHWDKNASIGIAVSVYIKTTYTRNDKTDVKYEYYADYIEPEENVLAHKLNSFNRIRADEPGKNSGISEISYTPEAAIFFYDLIIGMYTMIDKMNEFFKNNKMLESAIDKKLLLLGNNNHPKNDNEEQKQEVIE